MIELGIVDLDTALVSATSGYTLIPSPPCAISSMRCDTSRAADVGLLNRRFDMPDRCYCNIECSQLLVSIPHNRKNGIKVQMPDNIERSIDLERTLSPGSRLEEGSLEHTK